MSKKKDRNPCGGGDPNPLHETLLEFKRPDAPRTTRQEMTVSSWGPTGGAIRFSIRGQDGVDDRFGGRYFYPTEQEEAQLRELLMKRHNERSAFGKRDRDISQGIALIEANNKAPACRQCMGSGRWPYPDTCQQCMGSGVRRE